ncbi:ANR45-like protein [Mya arenaria]|uniref:ANR45-like protein n=1 Tax=Mya arenaria TaxID=6604 RepID=A0ABY7GA24_MYAAR|nr:ANR45-like protein [Mya arenaria]
MTLQDSENPDVTQDEVEVLLPNTTIVTHCILKNDIPRLTKSFEDDTDPFKEIIAELINQRDDNGKSPLDIACTLGRADMVLVEFNCNLQQRNTNGERAKETAVRYNHAECVDYLDWAEARSFLAETCRTTQETVQDPEKVMGRLTKEDKGIVLNSCKEKLEWIDNNPGATTQDFLDQKAALVEVLGPILLKISEPPPEKPEKK